MIYADDIQLELDRAAQAKAEQNDGKVRVCCRRAAGAAIRQWLSKQETPPVWGRSAVVQLRMLTNVESLPSEVQHAAARLTTIIAKDHTLPFDNDPIEDAEIIIRYFSR
jgi:hypothetical protein